MEYSIFDPKVAKPLHELTKKEAKEAYQWFILNIPSRLSELSKLVCNDGIKLDFSEESLKSLHDWFFDLVIQERSLGNKNPSSKLFSVCNDVGIYLGEALIKLDKQLHWALFNKTKKWLSHQRPVIIGFNVQNKDYHVDFDLLVCQYAFRILKTGLKEDDLFIRMLKADI